MLNTVPIWGFIPNQVSSPISYNWTIGFELYNMATIYSLIHPGSISLSVIFSINITPNILYNSLLYLNVIYNTLMSIILPVLL